MAIVWSSEIEKKVAQVSRSSRRNFNAQLTANMLGRMDNINEDWGLYLDDADASFWEATFAHAEPDDEPTSVESFEYVEESLCESVDEETRVDRQEPYWEHSRKLTKFEEAKAFCKHAVKMGDANAVVAGDEGNFQVHYRTWEPSPLTSYRTGRRYSKEESRYLTKQYLLWMPVEQIAIEVDRKQSSIEWWLCERGLRIRTRDAAYGIGNLDDASATEACDEIARNFLYGESLETLQRIGVLLEPPSVGNPPHLAPFVRISELSVDEKKRLLEFTADYGRLELTSKLATETEQYMVGFITGLQAANPAMACLALSRMSDLPTPLEKVRQMTLSYLRKRVLRSIPKYVEALSIAEARRRKDYSFCNSSEILWDEKLALANELLAAMEVGVQAWDSELRTLYYSLGGPSTYEAAISCDGFSAWLHADSIRKSIYRDSDVYNDTIRQYEIELAQYEIRAADFRLDSVRLQKILAQALPYDPRLASMIKVAPR